MKLKNLREKNGITQEQLAEDLGVDPRTIQRWERGIPSLKALLVLAKYLNVYPQDLLDEDEAMPNFNIGKSGVIDFDRVKNQVLVSLTILSQGNIMNDIYRNISVEYTDEMKEDLLHISLKLTNLYARIIFGLYTKKWIDLLPVKDVVSLENIDLYFELCAIDLFHPVKGILKNPEIDNAVDELCFICNKYKPNPLYTLVLPPRIGGLLIQLYTPTTTQAQQCFVCEQIFLELLSFVGKQVRTQERYFCHDAVVKGLDGHAII